MVPKKTQYRIKYSLQENAKNFDTSQLGWKCVCVCVCVRACVCVCAFIHVYICNSYLIKHFSKRY